MKKFFILFLLITAYTYSNETVIKEYQDDLKKQAYKAGYDEGFDDGCFDEKILVCIKLLKKKFSYDFIKDITDLPLVKIKIVERDFV